MIVFQKGASNAPLVLQATGIVGCFGGPTYHDKILLK